MIIKLKREVSPEKYYLSLCLPVPVNPVRELRIAQGLMQEQLATLSNLANRSSVIRTEQGWFEEIPEAIIKGLKLNSQQAEDLQDSYKEWQQLNRESHWRLFGDLKKIKFTLDEHPLETIYRYWSGPPVGNSKEQVALQNTLNDTLVAKLLCVNQPTLHYFRNNPNNQHKVPTPFVTALGHNGYSFDEIQYFVTAYEAYRTESGVGNQITSLKAEILKELNNE